MTPQQTLDQLRAKWRDRKDVWNNTKHPDYLKFRSDRLHADWIKNQLAKQEATAEYAQQLFNTK
jgi:hypothetical protein